ncbi:MAG: FAA hydrolase family protein [Nitriliruptor sp.]|nr:MAG: FAA hydrolase family protein [Nitriliruptor sp.]
MKLARVGAYGEEIPVVIDGDAAIDVRAVTEDYGQAFFASGGLVRLRDYVERTDAELPRLSLDGQRYGAPVSKPYQLLCVGLNYAMHARESGMELPSEPVVFNKAPGTVVGPNDTVLLPPGSSRTDWEVELAVVIGERARYLRDEHAAAACIAGYAISNDVSEREWQLERGGQWVKGKSAETFNPMGPWLVTADEVGDPQDLRLQLSVNGRVLQASSTSDMVFGVLHIVWYLSQFLILEPGDVINTGTPFGVGMGQNPPRYLREGDVMELRIDRLGAQRQDVGRAQR